MPLGVTPHELGSRIVQRLFSRLRFPWLFLLFALMLVVDLALPDVVPMLDEAILALGTALFALWKKRRQVGDERSAGSDAAPVALSRTR